MMFAYSIDAYVLLVNSVDRQQMRVIRTQGDPQEPNYIYFH